MPVLKSHELHSSEARAPAPTGCGRRWRRRWQQLLLAGFLCGGLPAYAAAWDIEQLMALLGSQREGRATFVETTYIKKLDRPLESSGELMFAAPDRLEKLTLKPRRELLALAGDRLNVERNGRKRTMQMSDYPQIAVFIESIRGTLTGDRAALERAYELALDGDRQRWHLLLTPRPAAGGEGAAPTVSRIDISGRDALVDSVEIVQADGDRSLLRIDNHTSPAAAGAPPAP